MTGTAPGPLSGTLVVNITLDLEAEDDRQLLLDLVRRADVLVENLRTGVLDRLGLCFEALDPLNPGSDTTVRRGGSGYDQIAQGEAGLMSLTGSGPDDPEKVGTPIADLLAGMDGAYPFQSTRWTIAGEVGRAQGNHHASIAPYGPFHWADGSV
jgi:CoA-transferase family III